MSFEATGLLIDSRISLGPEAKPQIEDRNYKRAVENLTWIGGSIEAARQIIPEKEERKQIIKDVQSLLIAAVAKNEGVKHHGLYAPFEKDEPDELMAEHRFSLKHGGKTYQVFVEVEHHGGAIIHARGFNLQWNIGICPAKSDQMTPEHSAALSAMFETAIDNATCALGQKFSKAAKEVLQGAESLSDCLLSEARVTKDVFGLTEVRSKEMDRALQVLCYEKPSTLIDPTKNDVIKKGYDRRFDDSDYGYEIGDPTREDYVPNDAWIEVARTGLKNILALRGPVSENIAELDLGVVKLNNGYGGIMWKQAVKNAVRTIGVVTGQHDYRDSGLRSDMGGVSDSIYRRRSNIKSSMWQEKSKVLKLEAA